MINVFRIQPDFRAVHMICVPVAERKIFFTGISHLVRIKNQYYIAAASWRLYNGYGLSFAGRQAGTLPATARRFHIMFNGVRVIQYPSVRKPVGMDFFTTHIRPYRREQIRAFVYPAMMDTNSRSCHDIDKNHEKSRYFFKKLHNLCKDKTFWVTNHIFANFD